MMNDELQMTNGERSIDEKRMPNRTSPASTFEIQHSSFHSSSNQSGDCPARCAKKTPKAKPQSLPRQRDIRQELIEADLVDCMVVLPG